MSITHTSTIPGTLKQVRDMLIKETGRFELVNTDGSDYGANEYINRGVKFLATRFPRVSSRIQDIASGATRLSLSSCQSVLSAWITNDEGMTQLKKISFDEFRTLYNTLMNDADNTAQPTTVQTACATGKPYHYCIADSGLAPQDNFPDSETWVAGDNATYDYWDVTPGDYWNTKIIMLAPIPDETYTLRVFGHFWPKVLEADGDINYWTMVYPALLVKATSYELECAHRNTAGQRDALYALEQDLIGLWHNETYEQMAGIDRIDMA